MAKISLNAALLCSISRLSNTHFRIHFILSRACLIVRMNGEAISDYQKQKNSTNMYRYRTTTKKKMRNGTGSKNSPLFILSVTLEIATKNIFWTALLIYLPHSLTFLSNSRINICIKRYCGYSLLGLSTKK